MDLRLVLEDDALVGAGQLRRARDGRYLPRGAEFPAGRISLRSASPDAVAVVEEGRGEVIGTVESASTPSRSISAPR